MWPSRWKFANGHLGWLMGIWWKFGEPSPAELGIEIGEQPSLQQWILAEINAGNDVTGAECDLLCLGEEIVRIAIEGHFADHFNRHDLLGDELRGVQHIEGQRVRRRLVENLKTQLELGKVAAGDRFEQVTAMEVGVRGANLDCLIP